MPVGGKGEGREPREPRGPVTQPAPAPVVQAPQPGPVTAPAAPAPAAENRRAPAAPAPQGAPPDIPSQSPLIARPQQPAPDQAATLAQRPGTQASQQALLARAGVRLGAFDPRFRAPGDEQRGIIQALGAAGTPLNQAGAAGAPVPPSLGFQPRQFEDEQVILNALR